MVTTIDEALEYMTNLYPYYILPLFFFQCIMSNFYKKTSLSSNSLTFNIPCNYSTYIFFISICC